MEMGWTTDPRAELAVRLARVTAEQQGEYLVGRSSTRKQNWSPWVGLMTRDLHRRRRSGRPSDEQYYWSITNPDGTSRRLHGAQGDAEVQ